MGIISLQMIIFFNFMMINGFSLKRPKKLQQTIKDFSKHPVITQKVYWQQKFDKEKEAYEERYKDYEIKTSEEADASFETAKKKCEEKMNHVDAEINQYMTRLSEWGSW